MKKKIALHNLGCKVNAYELEAMRQMLLDGGYEIVPFKEGADVYIINTCTVTNIADRKSRQMLHKAKKMNPESVVVAVGCYVQASAEELLSDETVDIIIGNNKKQQLVDILVNYFAKKNFAKADYFAKGEYSVENGKIKALTDINATDEYEELQVTDTAEKTRAYIKVQDGCNQFCTYCIIPYMRGRVRSRDLNDVCEEVKRFAKAGYHEVVLTGIHLSSYELEQETKKDKGCCEDNADNNSGLLELVKAVAAVNGIERIRLGSLEPRIITEDFVKTIAKMEKVCPHFHLSLQSGCDETLKRMNRRYTTAEFKRKCEILRQHYRQVAITTDIIVGFPGETEEEFAKTKAFVKEIGFYETHIFKYSPRKGTKAADMPEQVPEAIKGQRSKELIAIGEAQKQIFMEAFMDEELVVLIEEKIKVAGVEYCVGHTREYLKVIIDKKDAVAGEDITVVAREIVVKEYVLGEIP